MAIAAPAEAHVAGDTTSMYRLVLGRRKLRSTLCQTSQRAASCTRVGGVSSPRAANAVASTEDPSAPVASVTSTAEAGEEVVTPPAVFLPAASSAASSCSQTSANSVGTNSFASGQRRPSGCGGLTHASSSAASMGATE